LKEIAPKKRQYIVQYIAAAAHAPALDAQLIRMVTVASSLVRLNNAGRSVSATRVRATRDGRWPAFAKRPTFAYGLARRRIEPTSAGFGATPDRPNHGIINRCVASAAISASMAAKPRPNPSRP
jgi:hypothetical protein